MEHIRCAIQNGVWKRMYGKQSVLLCHSQRDGKKTMEESLKSKNRNNIIYQTHVIYLPDPYTAVDTADNICHSAVITHCASQIRESHHDEARLSYLHSES